MHRIILNDLTLRDGNHAVGHQLSKKQIAMYCKIIDKVGVDIVEIGHGNGLGASTLQLGLAKVSDQDMITIARKHLVNTKLGVFIIPGFGKIHSDLRSAIDLGVDIVRVGSHCTEADVTEKHIAFCRNRNIDVVGVLMMSHMASKNTLIEESKKLISYGVKSIIIMDSAGALLPEQVSASIQYLTSQFDIAFGFHAHNNLGMAISNSIAAIKAGATILDGTAKGFGAGAGNTSLEVLASVLSKLGYLTKIDLYSLLDACDYAEEHILDVLPKISSLNIISGLYGIFSGFEKPVLAAAKDYNIDPRHIMKWLGENKVLAGQEDLIIEAVQDIKKNMFHE